ncbi:hypothetical protein RD792_011679 [Penstemon davidsonii]|uniref:Carbonic anhydrase n=1 Tax=Penstemon davidsonii TaxID=160366 RepID=A0ABR0CUS0_9LAMI|nr:hypothetical protein RD792_011679 [Penstemon davidsonii]
MYKTTNSSIDPWMEQVEEPLQFTYLGEKGPEKWGTLNPKFSLCGNGKSQSPINIITKQVLPNNKLKPLIRGYHPVNVTMVNNRITVSIDYPEQTGGIIVDGKPYALKQMHWHSPSEHRINGKRYAAEMHMVHVSDDGNVITVATLFKNGPPDPVLTKLHKQFNELAYEVKSHEKAPNSVENFPPKELRITPHKYYKYTGSSSVPPCGEGLTYLVLAKVRSISREQVEGLKAPLEMECKYNARPCQAINGRRVEVYE